MLILSSIALAIGAAIDGKSTIDFLTKSNGKIVEVDPVAVFLFGTNRPSTSKVIGIGSAVIGCEILAASVLSHFFPHLGPYIVTQQLIQATVHVYLYFRNEKLLAALKA